MMQRDAAVVLQALLGICLIVAPLAGATGSAAATGGPTPDSTLGSSASGTSAQTAAPGSAPGLTLGVERRSSETFVLTATYEVPPEVSDLRVALGPLSVLDATGFEQCGSGRACWDGETENPSLTLRYDLGSRANQYTTVINDSEVFAPAPRVYTAWRAGGERRTAPLFAKAEYGSYTVDSERAVIGNATLFYGPHTEYDRTANGTTFRLIVPDGADLGPPRERLLDALSGAAGELDVGNSNEEVIAVGLANTPRMTESGLAGAAIGNAFWARASSPLAGTHNVWLHEYVHTRQRFGERDRDMEWFVEASAEYYAARLSYDLGYVGDLRYEWELKSKRVSASTSVLANPSSWARPNVPYRKGALVLAALDARIRDRTGGEHTLEDVFRRLNTDRPLTYDRFVETVVTVSDDPSMSEWLDRYVRTTDTPEYNPQEPNEQLPNPPQFDRLAALAPTSPTGFAIVTIGLVVASMLVLSVLSTIGRAFLWIVSALVGAIGWVADALFGRRSS